MQACRWMNARSGLTTKKNDERWGRCIPRWRRATGQQQLSQCYRALSPGQGEDKSVTVTLTDACISCIRHGQGAVPRSAAPRLTSVHDPRSCHDVHARAPAPARTRRSADQAKRAGADRVPAPSSALSSLTPPMRQPAPHFVGPCVRRACRAVSVSSCVPRPSARLTTPKRIVGSTNTNEGV